MKGTTADRFADVVNDLITEMEHASIGDWRMPWQTLGPDMLCPTNAATGQPYTAGNRWLLAITAMMAGLSGGAWATRKQWASIGANVRSGAKALGVIAVPMIRRSEQVESIDDAEGEVEDDAAGRTREFMVWRSRQVWHSTQVDGWTPPVPAALADHDPIPAADALISSWRASGMVIEEGGDRAYYGIRDDVIHVPLRRQFSSAEHWYATVAHEASHWTGPRLGRELGGRSAGDAYATEELIAELSAAVIAAALGIEPATREDHARYLGSWLRILKKNPRHLLTVGSKAEAAAAYLLDLGPAQAKNS
jgi:antirestriction protein ArdC